MRRRPKLVDGRPERLATFVESDWPGRTWQDRYAAWTAAQDDYLREHDWPGGPLDVLYRRMFVKSRHFGTPLQLGVSDHFGLPAERANNGLHR